MTGASIFSAHTASPERAATTAGPVPGASRWTHLVLLVLLLPLFGQSFHYVKALSWLWTLSKLWPLVSLPLALLLFTGPRPAGSRQVSITFVWLLLVPTFIATVTFQQTFFIGLTAQVKLLPILYFFSFLGLLRWMQPTLRELATSFLVIAAATFVLTLLVWRFAPQSAYTQHYVVGDSPFLGADSRGNRIRMPMYFGLIGIFFCYRRFLGTLKPKWLLLAGTGFAIVFALVKMRSIVLGIVAMAAINAFVAATPKMRVALVALMPFGIAALFSVPYVASVFSTDRSFAFDVRMTTTTKAIDFLGTNPFAWLFGVGTISPMDPAGLITYFNHFFFLADITWMGVLFEFGLVGAALILAIPVRGFMLVRQARAMRDDPFLAALQDYLLYAMLISEMFPMTMAPGELTVIMAIAVYVLQRDRAMPSPALR